MKNLQVQVCTWIEENRNRSIKLLKKMVEQRSVQGNEASAQAVVLEKCRQLSLDIDLWEPGGKLLKQHPHFVATRTSFKDSPNIVGVLKGKGGGKSVILNGHIDVVPEGDLEQWDVDPYQAAVTENRLYGRGSTDMKGGNVCLLMAMEAIKASGISLKGDVIFQSVIEEESGGAGTLAAILRGYKADAAIIPEPTKMKIFQKQQGSMWFRLKIKGRSAHGGTRYEGISAIEKSTLVVKHILELEKKRNEKITDALYKKIPIPVPINIGKIEGGTWPSSVADLVTLEGRCGIAPNETIEEVQTEFQEWISDLSSKDEWFNEHPVELEWFGARWLPNEIGIEHPLTEALINSYKEIMDKEPIIEASPWGTDAGLLSHAGDIPSIVFGPGETEMAHFPNEFIEIDKIIECTKILAVFLMHWCGVSEQMFLQIDGKGK
ncbi:peptidase [Bacillus sp. CMF21]|uniref:peptidase n=1 Tax=Metabacillus dongyingensis TaxID=2874282 RepID=UPI001CBF44CE|nr:peptidase [Metabacillus dongyingensis]UAL50441.1 peptidase [Metabacillus dongyingensis]USK26699.1 peptidase [Bacillus sp. CMF21]